MGMVSEASVAWVVFWDPELLEILLAQPPAAGILAVARRLGDGDGGWSAGSRSCWWPGS